MKETIEDIDNNFLVKTIGWNVKQYGECPFIYIWLNTDVYKELDGLTPKEQAPIYMRIHKMLSNKLDEAEKLGLIKKKFSHNYDDNVWEVTT